MDSGNSGSLQSSSGGDDDFDSRGGGVDSSPLAALFRPAPSSSAAAFSLHGSLYGLQEFTAAAPSQQQQQQQHQAGLWSGSFTGAAGASSSSSPRASGADKGARQQAEAPATAQGSAPPPPPPPRGSRKRTRASRRAPTTVLTTDTSNFRAMVQEFTGIPSPPFAAGLGGAPAAGLRTRFDHIFPPSSSLRSAAGHSASLPPYLLRPFAQKPPSSAPSGFPPFTSSSSSSSTLSSNIGVANASAATGAATTAGASSNPTATAQAAAAGGTADMFQLTSSALLRLQDPSGYHSFQNLLESQSSSQSIFGAASGFAQAPPRLQEPASSMSEFLAGIGSGNFGLTHGELMGSEGMQLHPRSDVQHGGDELSGLVASGGSCKPNSSTHAGAATSSLAAASGEKPPDAGAPGTSRPARGEGLDPWICTSE